MSTIGDYGQEQLIAAGEQTMLRQRHRDWYQQLAEQASGERISQRQVYWITRLTGEHANVRAAVEFCLSEPRQAEAALRLVTGLPWLYWSSPGVSSEGLRWLDRALAQATAPTVSRARALLVAGYLARWLADADIMGQLLDEGERLAQQLRDAPALALAAFVRGVAAFKRNDLSATIQADEHGLAILSGLPEPDQQREVTLRLQLLLQLGLAAAPAGDFDRAQRSLQEALGIAESRGATVNQTWAMWGLGLIAWWQDHTVEADQLVRRCIRLAQTTGVPDANIAALSIEVMAWIAADQQRHQRAATLLGVADRALADLGKPLDTPLIADHDGCERHIRAALGDAALIEAFRHGQALQVDSGLVYALGEPDPAEPSPAEDVPAPLTRRERQVADVVARGLSNKEIANVLLISHRTVDSHIEHILAKLDFTNRAQIAAWVALQHPSAAPS
jgi:DNA-binding CsgD family transcriptional regulator